RGSSQTPTRSGRAAWVRASRASRASPSCDAPARAARATLALLTSSSVFFPHIFIRFVCHPCFERLTWLGLGCSNRKRRNVRKLPMHQQAHLTQREVLINQAVRGRSELRKTCE